MTEMERMIANHPFFADMRPEHLSMLAVGAAEMAFRAGEFLFREGDPANQFFLILEGRVSLEIHEPMDGTFAVQEVGPEEVVGWSWLFAPFVWHLQARAIEPTKAIVLSGAHLLIAAERSHEFGYELMKRVAQIVVHRLRAIRQHMISSERKSVKLDPGTAKSP